MSVVFALVLLGCADDGTACERLSVPSEQYATKASCQAHQESALSSDAALKADYPTVVSRCLQRGAVAVGRPRSQVAVRD